MKFSKLLIAMLLVIGVIFTFAACKGQTSNANHDHEFSDIWYNDQLTHWHYCTTIGCAEMTDEGSHTFDEGIVTTEPTAETEGVKTIKCTVCGYAKTESVPKLEHAHSWSSEWSSDQFYHWHASACGHEDKDFDEHLFDDGYILQDATDTVEGIIEYTCVDCGYSYLDVIGVIGHKHAFSSEWSSDANYHWHPAICGHSSQRDYDKHTFGEGQQTLAPTEDAEGILSYFCTTCNYEKQEPIAKLPHSHKFAEAWSTDEDYHWHDSTCGHSDSVIKYKHTWNEGEITLAPTETTDGIFTYTCGDCGKTKNETIVATSHTHTYGEYQHDSKYHWQIPTCGHSDAIEQVKHSYDANGNCVCGFHGICDTCGGCLSDGCLEHTTKCAFRKENSLVTFAPSTTLGDPEGPNGNSSKPTDYTKLTGVQAQNVVLENGAHATVVTLNKGCEANSAISFLNHTGYEIGALTGYNYTLPVIAGQPLVVRMHFTNLGGSEITFKFSTIDYWVDKGAVTLTLAPGESATALMTIVSANGTIGYNSNLAFLEAANAGASVAIWGEFVANGLDSISVASPADKLSFNVGEEFTTEGLVLKGNGTKWDRGYICGNFNTTYPEGYVFTTEDVGTKTVTVTFDGKTCKYIIEVTNHAADKCPECGKCTNQVCEIADCGEKCQGHFTSETITLMSFNIWTKGYQYNKNVANLTGKLVAEQPDIIGTQEENGQWTALLTNALARYGYKNVIMYRDGAPSSSSGNEGTGIWYNSLRFTLEDWGYFWMSDTPNVASAWTEYGETYKRVTTWAKLTDKVTGKTFVYYNTHIGLSEEVWYKSAEMIMEHMHEDYNNGYSVIVSGDFNFALNTEGGPEAYGVFMNGLSDAHYSAAVKDYDSNKQNTYSNFGEFQGSALDTGSDFGGNGREHVLPIDYIMYSAGLNADYYTILREELPEGVSAPAQDYFSSDHFAVKAVLSFNDDYGTHKCWEPCSKCGLCRDEACEICTEKCLGHHVCDTLCPSCGLCLNVDGECQATHCPQYKVTLDNAHFASGANRIHGCVLTEDAVAGIVLQDGKTFEGFVDNNMKYYTLDDLKNLALTGDLKLTAMYQEDMLHYASSDKDSSPAAGVSAVHKYENGMYMTTVTFVNGVAAGTKFAGRGAKDTGSMPLNWCAPATADSNIAIIYIYSHAKNPVTIQYMVENYGAQNDELIVTLQPGLNRIVLNYGGHDNGKNKNEYQFYSCDHQIILKEAATEDIVLDTYGYVFVEEYISEISISTLPKKVAYEVGESFSLDGLKVKTVLEPWSHQTYVTNYTTSLKAGYVFTEDDLGKHNVTVSFGDYTATFEIEVCLHVHTVDETVLRMPGDALTCTECGQSAGTVSMDNWALFTVPAAFYKNTVGSAISGTTIQYGKVNGIDGTIITFPAGAQGGNGTSNRVWFHMENQGDMLNMLPNVGNEFIMYFENYGPEAITINFVNDSYSEVCIELTIPAASADGTPGYAIGKTTLRNANGANYFYMYLENGQALTADASIGMYGYIDLSGMLKDPSVKSVGTTIYTVGETYDSSDLVLLVTTTNTGSKTISVTTGFTTNLDGYTFTEDDIGTKEVVVTIAGVTCKYTINVVPSN